MVCLVFRTVNKAHVQVHVHCVSDLEEKALRANWTSWDSWSTATAECIQELNEDKSMC